MIAILEDIKKAFVEEGKKNMRASETSRDAFLDETSTKQGPFRFYQNLDVTFSWRNFLKKAVAIAAVLCIAVLACREIYSHRQALNRLNESEAARAYLVQSVADMQQKIQGQHEEIVKLSMDVEQVKAKASTIDFMRDEYLLAIQNIKVSYEAKIAELHAMFKEHQKVIEFLQNQMQMVSAMVAPEGEVKKKTKAVKKASFKEGAAGEIVQVDMGFHFIIVTLGANQGVKSGDSIQIYQGNKPIGRARVDRVYPSLSAATILSENTLQKVQKGDQVRLGVF